MSRFSRWNCPPIAVRFEAKFIAEPNSGCWLWTEDCDKDGYGRFWTGEQTRRAHRVSYELYRGSPPKSLHVLHRCDTPSCVNPNHLWLGTTVDNVRDKVRKNRCAKRSRHSQAKLTEANVIAIRASGENQSVIAQRFGITPSAVSGIKNNRTWKVA